LVIAVPDAANQPRDDALEVSVSAILQLRKLSERLNDGERACIARRLARLAIDLDADAMVIPEWLQ
jgi:hypothetical protein